MSEEKSKVLAVGAHPDDIEFFFAGTLAKLRELHPVRHKTSNGVHRDAARIYMLTICNGTMGSEELDWRELRETRWKEAQESAALIGAHYESCDIWDLELDLDRHKAKDILVGQIRQIKPDIVLTHTPKDNYMPDHRVTSFIVSDALFCAMLPNYNPGRRTSEIRTRREIESNSEGYRYKRRKSLPLPALYYGDPFPGFDMFGEEQKPTFLVDITSTMKVKREMLLKHKSQGAWLKAGHRDSDYIRTAMEWNKKRGKLVGVEFAEAIFAHKGTPYNQEPRLENLLGDSVKYIESK